MFALLLSGAVGLGIAQAQTAQDLKSFIRSYLEPEIRETFDKFDGIVEKRIADGVISAPSPREREMAIMGVKNLLYYKSYSLYECIIKFRSDDAALKACEARVISAIAKQFGLAEYADVVSNKNSRLCEMKSRLFEKEIEFPPFDFLAGAQLYDIEKLNECILASSR